MNPSELARSSYLPSFLPRVTAEPRQSRTSHFRPLPKRLGLYDSIYRKRRCLPALDRIELSRCTTFVRGKLSAGWSCRSVDEKIIADSPILISLFLSQMRSNSLAWSPTFPTAILLASEDHNLYTFDVRNLASPTQIYKAHVAAVMSCDWSPTGTEFVSGGWDRTVRIWKEGVGKQPEVYHTKRMQR